MSPGEDTTAANPTIVLRSTRARRDLDLLEPLWKALQEHHARIAPLLASRPPRRLGDAWRVRRSKYERWLEDPETFFVLAEANRDPVGYAFVTVGPGYASWATGERAAVLETLSVLPDFRGSGVGAQLLEAMWSRLAEKGVDDVAITTTETNTDAQRFYERHGFERGFVVYQGTRQQP